LGLEAAASQVLMAAVKLDEDKRYVESLACYREGIDLLLNILKLGCTDDKRQKLRTRIEEYMGRAEKLKKAVETAKQSGQFHEQIHIKANTSGYSYRSVFGPFIDEQLTEVEIDDPYIRLNHQLLNFLRFCELLVCTATNLKSIVLLTTKEEESQKSQENAFREMTDSLDKRSICLKVNYSNTLHDREIRFNNGILIKIGRGLDYFKACPKFSIGYINLDLRLCHETLVDIFYKQNLVKIK